MMTNVLRTGSRPAVHATPSAAPTPGVRRAAAVKPVRVAAASAAKDLGARWARASGAPGRAAVPTPLGRSRLTTTRLRVVGPDAGEPALGAEHTNRPTAPQILPSLRGHNPWGCCDNVGAPEELPPVTPELLDWVRPMLDLHATSWEESEGDEGEIPYSAIDLRSDGTYTATVYGSTPSQEVTGRWSAQVEAPPPGGYGRYSRLLSTRLFFVENQARRWGEAPTEPAPIQKFNVQAFNDLDAGPPNDAGDGLRGRPERTYRLSWEVAFYEMPKYDPV